MYSTCGANAIESTAARLSEAGANLERLAGRQASSSRTTACRVPTGRNRPPAQGLVPAGIWPGPRPGSDSALAIGDHAMEEHGIVRCGMVFSKGSAGQAK
jgi:hypothetical protein